MKINYEFLKKRKGFTLIEIIVTLAILSIVVATISNFFTHNLKVYSRSEKLSQVQFDVRMASDYIIREVRNTENISLTDDNLANTLDLSNLQSKFASVKNVDFEIKFHGTNYLLAFRIDGSDPQSKNNYSVGSEIILNNIRNTYVGITDTIYYN